MRYVLILWAIPVILFWGWYGLSAYNLHFGMYFLERGFHDLVFQLYSQMLGLPAEDIPVWLAWVFFVDSLIIFFGAAALRWYRVWVPFVWKIVSSPFKKTESEREIVRKIHEPLNFGLSKEVNYDLIGPRQPAE